VKPVTATKAVVGSGRLLVVIGLGTGLDDAAFFSLSVLDARGLVDMVQEALDAPPPRGTPRLEDGAGGRRR
jgi:hypothetical protein